MKDYLKKHSLFVLAVLTLALSLPVQNFAQNETAATILGQVIDATGATIPNATVLVSSAETGFERRVQTDEEGNYTVSPIPPGVYTVTVEQQGFKKFVVNITLNARDRRPVDIALEAGLPTEVVTVTDEPPLIQESSTGQAVITGNQVVELPLNNRDFIRLTELIPGVSSSLDDETPTGLTSRLDISVNGMRRNQNNFLVDGASNVDPGSNITALSTPTVDSIKEFKVLTSNYTAEFGRSGGAVVTIVTRGGSNKFHGSLYEFVRNDRFNANTFFNNAAGARKPKLRYNNFGGTFSGPLPFLAFNEGGPVFTSGKDKTFFFFSQEFRRVIRGLTDTSVTVPNAADRAGNFAPRLTNFLCRNAAGTIQQSAAANSCNAGFSPVTTTDTAGQTIQVRVNQIFVPGTSIAYANNQVPISQFDPRALALLQAFPLPNLGSNGFVVSRLNLSSTQQSTVRIDHNFNANNKIFGRYTHDKSYTQEPGGLFTGLVLPNIATTDTNVPGQTLAISYTSILSPSVTNEVAFNSSGSHIQSELVGRGRRTDYPGSDLIPQRFPENGNNAIPSISISTFSGTLASTQGFDIQTRINLIRDNLTWTTGNHVLKFGAELSFEKKKENANNVVQGSFSFTGTQTAGPAALGGTAVTGLGAASYLLGLASSYFEDETDVTADFRFGRREFYAQDTFRALPNLTLDFGVRYQYFQPVKEVNNVLNTFDPELFSLANAPQCANAACSVLVTGTGSLTNGIALAGVNSKHGEYVIPPDKNNFSPRVGLAYSPDFEQGILRGFFGRGGRSVIRMGYGLYYEQPLTGVFTQNVQVNPPFNNRVSFNTSGTTQVTLANPTGGLGAAITPRSLIGTDPNFKTPIVQQWSLGLQRELFKNAVIDVSYVGTKGDNLIRPVDINNPSPAQVIAAGGTPTVNNINAARPYRGYTSITYRESSGKFRYHGFLSSFRYRFASGSDVTVNYTFSKNLTNASNDRDAVDIPQFYGLKDVEYGPARTNRDHVFSAGYVYELPFFRKSQNYALRLLLGGFQISGITIVQSGLPIARILISNSQNGTRGTYANLIGDPRSGLAGERDDIGLPFIFDPTVFADPLPGQFGNAPRGLARLPWQKQTNLSLVKNIYFDEDNRYRLQLRAEAFNLFNTTQFTSVGTVFNSALPLSAQNFGRPTAARLPREFQFAIKFNF